MGEPRNILQGKKTQEKQIKNKITQALTYLTPREERILRMRFGVGMNTDHTLREVSSKLFVNPETAGSKVGLYEFVPPKKSTSDVLFPKIDSIGLTFLIFFLFLTKADLLIL